MDYFRSENGWADLSEDDRHEVFMDILQGDGDLTAELIGALIRNYGAEDRLEVKAKQYATLYVLTMEDAEVVLNDLGYQPTKSQLDEMEYRIRKAVEWGLGECWGEVMAAACEDAWRELQSEATVPQNGEQQA